ncbi:DMT family transporter [Xenophilus arseniciresistens]|uniref:DMT family transporter n=1 Tax=Xenophilus arseniciresistens TaxID=1283306 RepID=A0AAE3T0Q4_9BURK|nr:DMT family transporter [Xenophilus arseniciresistens]MDA7418354.1 DMT family transporter [Xenophilus arseniciresistens]
MPVLAILFNAFVWGLSWVPFRQVGALGWHPLWTTAIVYLCIIAVVLVLRRGTLRGALGEPRLWWLGLAAGLTNAGFNWGVTQGDVLRVVLLFYLMPLWMVLLAWALLGERPTRAALARMALALAGVALVLKTPGSEWPLPASLPDWLGLGAGFGFALTNVFLRRAAHAPGEWRAMAMFVGCAGVSLGAALLLGGLAGPLPPPALTATLDWLPWVAMLAIGFAVANVALQYGAVRLAAGTVSVLLLSEVLFATVSSVAAGAAQLTPRVAAGGLLLMAAALWAAIARPPAPRDHEPLSAT